MFMFIWYYFEFSTWCRNPDIKCAREWKDDRRKTKTQQTRREKEKRNFDITKCSLNIAESSKVIPLIFCSHFVIFRTRHLFFVKRARKRAKNCDGKNEIEWILLWIREHRKIKLNIFCLDSFMPWHTIPDLGVFFFTLLPILVVNNIFFNEVIVRVFLP